jgi:Uma2 family endonuclease
MELREKLYTVDDLAQLANLPENAEKRFELIDGVIYEVNAPTPLHAYVSAKFYRHFDDYNEEHQLGFAFPDSVSYILYDDKEFIPDASFVSKAKVPGFPLPDEFRFAPDLAVEVVSPSNYPRQILNKVQNYLKYGTKLVWVAYPDEQVVDVYRLAEEGLNLRTFDINSTLEGEDVLPGFRLDVRRVFPSQD